MLCTVVVSPPPPPKKKRKKEEKHKSEIVSFHFKFCTTVLKLLPTTFHKLLANYCYDFFKMSLSGHGINILNSAQKCHCIWPVHRDRYNAMYNTLPDELD